jgi:hypothetical protein
MRVFRPAETDSPAGSAIRDPNSPSTSAPAPLQAARTDTVEWASGLQLRGITRVPTYTVGRARERRAYVRARLLLPLCLQRVAGQRHAQHYTLHTSNISSSGLFFLAPFQIESETPIEVEVQLLIRSLGRATVRMSALAHVVRTEPVEKRDWYGVAAAFDDISYRREENLLERFSPS